MSLTLGNAKAESSDRAADARPLPSGVVTFLLSDVVGSTRLWENASGVMPSTLDRHDQLIELAVSANNGVLLKAKGEGDSTFSVFGRASDAIAAARDAQIALQREPWPLDTPISVRMSVHTGEAVERHRDYFGQTVNRAARLRPPPSDCRRRAGVDLAGNGRPRDRLAARRLRARRPRGPDSPRSRASGARLPARAR